jgi:hypothetical protein
MTGQSCSSCHILEVFRGSLNQNVCGLSSNSDHYVLKFINAVTWHQWRHVSAAA